MPTATKTERKLSDYQISILKVLKRKPHTADETADLLNKAAARRTGYAFTSNRNFDSVHGCLRRLEDRGYVRRTYGGNSKSAQWEVTAKASKVLS